MPRAVEIHDLTATVRTADGPARVTLFFTEQGHATALVEPQTGGHFEHRVHVTTDVQEGLADALQTACSATATA